MLRAIPIQGIMRDHLDSVFRDFVRNDEVVDILLDLGVEARIPAPGRLRRLFEKSGGDPATLLVSFSILMKHFAKGLAAGLLDEAAIPQSPLFNSTQLSLLNILRRENWQASMDILSRLRKLEAFILTAIERTPEVVIKATADAEAQNAAQRPDTRRDNRGR